MMDHVADELRPPWEPNRSWPKVTRWLLWLGAISAFAVQLNYGAGLMAVLYESAARNALGVVGLIWAIGAGKVVVALACAFVVSSTSQGLFGVWLVVAGLAEVVATYLAFDEAMRAVLVNYASPAAPWLAPLGWATCTLIGVALGYRLHVTVDRRRPALIPWAAAVLLAIWVVVPAVWLPRDVG